MNFIQGVQRLLINATVIKGDDDAPTDFNSLQYPSDINISKQAIQYQLNRLVANRIISYEKKMGSITTIDGSPDTEAARTYPLAQDFVRFFGKSPFLQDDDQRQIPQIDYDDMTLAITRWNIDLGEPYAWYIERGTTRKIGLIQIPTEVRQWDYHYEADVSVRNETDTLPFIRELEAETFIDYCVGHFQIIRKGGSLGEIEANPGITAGRALLVSLMRDTDRPRRYGNSYR